VKEGEIIATLSKDNTLTFIDKTVNFRPQEIEEYLREAQRQCAILAEIDKQIGRSKEFLSKVGIVNAFSHAPSIPGANVRESVHRCPVHSLTAFSLRPSKIVNCPQVQVIGLATKTPLRGMKLCIHKENDDHSPQANVQVELSCSQHHVFD